MVGYTNPNFDTMNEIIPKVNMRLNYWSNSNSIKLEKITGRYSKLHETGQHSNEIANILGEIASRISIQYRP